MIDKNLEWPLHVTDRDDPAEFYLGPNLRELGQTLEYWNCPHIMPESDNWEIKDAKGRRVQGVIEYLEVKSLYLVDPGN